LGGGAARFGSPEHGRRPCPTAAGAGARRGGDIQGEGEIGEAQEDRRLTSCAMVISNVAEAAGRRRHGRQRRRPELGKGLDSGGRGLPFLRAWAEEDGEVRAELVAVSAGRGEAGNGGDREMAGARVSDRLQGRGEKGRGGEMGLLPWRRRAFIGVQGRRGHPGRRRDRRPWRRQAAAWLPGGRRQGGVFPITPWILGNFLEIKNKVDFDGFGVF
jgi:hypothetical protein